MLGWFLGWRKTDVPILGLEVKGHKGQGQMSDGSKRTSKRTSTAKVGGKNLPSKKSNEHGILISDNFKCQPVTFLEFKKNI